MEEKEIEFKEENDPDDCQNTLRIYSHNDYITLEIGGYTSDTHKYGSGGIDLTKRQIEKLVEFLQQ